METKEIALKFNGTAIAVLEQEIKKKRNLSVANSIGDRLLIRLLEALANDAKTLLFKIDGNKFIIRAYTETYDNDRQISDENRKTGGTNS